MVYVRKDAARAWLVGARDIRNRSGGRYKPSDIRSNRARDLERLQRLRRMMELERMRTAPPRPRHGALTAADAQRSSLATQTPVASR